MTYAWVALGGALGSLLRYLVSSIVSNFGYKDFPYATLIVNVIGSYFIGLISWCSLQLSGDQQLLRLFLITGFLGGFTTFSAFSYETLQLIHNGHIQTATVNVVLNVVIGLIAVWLGWQTLSRI